MAQNIVGGLFGQTTQDVYDNYAAQDRANAIALMNSPTKNQMGIFYGSQIGSGLGRAAAGLLGAEDPRLQQAKQIEQVKQWIAQSGIDINSPEGLAQAAQYAQSIGATEGAMYFGQQAQTMSKSAAEEKLKEAQAYAAIKKADAEKIPAKMQELLAAGYSPEQAQQLLKQWINASIEGTSKGSGTTVNLGGMVDKLFNKAASEKEGEEVGKQITSWGKVAANAPQSLQTANTAIDLIDKAFTGAGAESLMNLSKFARQVGVPVSDKASNTEISVALTKKLISEQGRTFPGSQSNLELQQILQKNPNALQEPRTQRYLWDLYKQDVRTSKESYKSAQAHKQAKGSYAGYDVYEGGAQASQNIINKTNRYNQLENKAKTTGKLTPQEAAEAKQLEADLGENK